MKTSMLFSSFARLSIAMFAAASSTVTQTVTKLAALPGRFLSPFTKLDHHRAAATAHSQHDHRLQLSTCLPTNQLAHSHSTVFLAIAHRRPRDNFQFGRHAFD